MSGYDNAPWSNDTFWTDLWDMVRYVFVQYMPFAMIVIALILTALVLYMISDIFFDDSSDDDIEYM